MPAVQHFAEHAVGVIAALVSALAILVVDPRVHDHLAGRVVAEEQPVLLEKLRAEPMLVRSEEHTSELQSLMRISYAVFCLKKKKTTIHLTKNTIKHI